MRRGERQDVETDEGKERTVEAREEMERSRRTS